MEYIKVKWLDASADDPLVIYCEVDNGRWEVRKVEVYADGRMDFANREEQSGDTRLGAEPVPSLEEIATYPELKPETISAEEFESVWRKAKAS